MMMDFANAQGVQERGHPGEDPGEGGCVLEFVAAKVVHVLSGPVVDFPMLSEGRQGWVISVAERELKCVYPHTMGD